MPPKKTEILKYCMGFNGLEGEKKIFIESSKQAWTVGRQYFTEMGKVSFSYNCAPKADERQKH